MDTQNTPIHLRLWHRGFWFLTIASMMLSMSATLMLPVLALWMVDSLQLSLSDVSLVMAAYGFGIWILGSMSSYLTQRYRRNHVYLVSVFIVLLVLLGLYLIYRYFPAWIGITLPITALCFGAFWGLAQIVLCSTLIIDVCESFQRTEANHATAWFRRFSLSLGPVIGLLLYKYVGITSVVIASAVAAFLAILLVSLVDFPFKAPDDNLRLFSCDRYLLTDGHLMIFMLLIISSVFGMILSVEADIFFFGIMMLGFLLAIIAEKIVFANAELESETITGLISISTALLLMLTRDIAVVHRIVPTLIGFGFGIIGSRFMLFFIKMSHHCQRGTSQSTFMLTWTSGIALGLAVGYLILENTDSDTLLIVSLSFIIVSLLFYHFIAHPWYMKHKNR